MQSLLRLISKDCQMESDRYQSSYDIKLMLSRIIKAKLCVYSLLIMFLATTSVGQSNIKNGISIIANKVLLAKAKKANFIKVYDNLLDVIPETSDQIAKKSSVRSAAFFKINRISLENALQLKEELIVIEIPYTDHGNSKLTLDLLKVSDSFYQAPYETESTNLPVHYRGIVRSYENSSIVALSLSRGELAGVVSIAGYGNLNIGKSTQDESHVIYNDRDLKSGEAWTCTMSEKALKSDIYNKSLQDNDLKNKSHKSTNQNIPDLDDVTIEVYVVVDYDIYNHFNGNSTSIDGFVTTQFNQVFAIYENEGINLEISEIYKYDTPDNFGEFPLTQFAAVTPIFDGHFAHLLSIKQSNTNGGGQAYIRGLCRNGTNYSESRIAIEDVFFPTFSNNVLVITHEIGHLLGSRHTHACVWNGSDTQIDDCGNILLTTDGFDNNNNGIIDELSEAEGSQCFNQQQAVIPNIGTIMSYCHLDPDVSVDLALGFHQQTGDRIRDFIVHAGCFFGDPILGDVNLDGYSNIIDALFISQCEVQVPNVMCPDF